MKCLRNRWRQYVLGIVAFVLVLYIIYNMWFFFSFGMFLVKGKESFIRRLVYELDHKKMLQDCRSIIEQLHLSQGEEKEYLIYAGASSIEGVSQKVLDSILETDFNIITVSHNSVFLHSKYQVGIVALAENIAPLEGTFKYVQHRQLIPGLYYHDYKYREDKDHDKYIDSLNPNSGE